LEVIIRARYWRFGSICIGGGDAHRFGGMILFLVQSKETAIILLLMYAVVKKL
jgi:hypothetical protein